MSDFPILGANVQQDGKAILKEHVIFEMNGIKIGVFGLATPETVYKTHPKNVEGIDFVDPAVIAQQQVDQLKDQVDVIVALAHLGTDKTSIDTSVRVAENVEGIDLIIDGHSHEKVSMYVGDTLIVQTGEYAENVGVVDFELDGNKKVVSINHRFVTKEDAESVQDNVKIKALIDGIEKSQESVLNEVVGCTTVRLEGEREIVRGMESNLGNLITDAMIYATGADIAITNGGGIRASIEVGDITKGDIITVLPFGNYVVTLEVTGSEIMEALELGAGDYPEPKGAFPQVGGLSYSIDPNQAKGQRINNVEVNDEPIHMDQTYILATNDFIAAGGDEYTMFVDNSITGHYAGLDEVLTQYMLEIGEVNPSVEGRIIEVEKTDHIEDDMMPIDTPSTQEGTETNYTVKLGDTLSHIAMGFGLTWQKLAEFNVLENPHLIFPDQIIRIPSH
jgi:2',3'-cyclic-nucleotide 2'-phosphodiesterase (5'-nucleotidase family)